MNHAFVDASWNEDAPPGGDVGLGHGGWGLVLVTPGALPARYQGTLEAEDNNVAEVRAVLEAVRLAPPRQPLHVHTDNEAVIAAVGRGRGPQLLHDSAREVMDEAEARGVALRVGYAPRTRRHMLAAHDLANEARRGQAGGSPGPRSDVLIEHDAAWQEARVSLRREAERVHARIPLDPEGEVPPSAQALLAAVALARPGEALLVRRASHVAQALWQRPERALRDAPRTLLRAARDAADAAGVTVEFLNLPERAGRRGR